MQNAELYSKWGFESKRGLKSMSTSSEYEYKSTAIREYERASGFLGRDRIQTIENLTGVEKFKPYAIISSIVLPVILITGIALIAIYMPDGAGRDWSIAVTSLSLITLAIVIPNFFGCNYSPIKNRKEQRAILECGYKNIKGTEETKESLKDALTNKILSRLQERNPNNHTNGFEDKHALLKEENKDLFKIWIEDMLEAGDWYAEGDFETNANRMRSLAAYIELAIRSSKVTEIPKFERQGLEVKLKQRLEDAKPEEQRNREKNEAELAKAKADLETETKAKTTAEEKIGELNAKITELTEKLEEAQRTDQTYVAPAYSADTSK